MKHSLVLFLVTAILAACGRSEGTSLTQAIQPDATVSITRATRTPIVPPTQPPPPPPQLCLVSRTTGVPASYVPPDLETMPAEAAAPRQDVQLRREAAQALQRLLVAAREDGQIMLALSGYRSYETQADVLQEEIKEFGEVQARRQVAEPGHSEHQLGVAVDVVTARRPFGLEEEFGNTPEGRWLVLNAPRFGFVISYPYGKEDITGYVYEPWHIRYVGPDLARNIVDSGLTLTEYLPHNHMEKCPPSR